MLRKWRLAVVAGLAALTAACGEEKPVVVPPPPPPPPVVIIPPRPTPPAGLPGDLAIPMVGADGVRRTILVDSQGDQRVWNLRAAFNVAALNCTAPAYAEIVPAYRTFLKRHGKALDQANRGVDALFKQKYGAGFIRPRETYMTQVYNYFAYPPTMGHFCNSALTMARESVSVVKPADLPAFSERSFGQFIAVYEQFYRAYDAYRAELAAWEAKYGPAASAPVASAARPAPALMAVPVQ
ncbi:hypothetical protein GTZ99_09835 [Novosphingobium sp. FSY-8]|uniref:Uncharacterized protein n=1 Tax=Novosphingobium ovatum TaxID=1908523 RepID=A0ABW9XEI3_9SPHN|nr:hypothetical protein [Novosphingobium ovatum]NBC36857.1 hypothetical protein [Novosphingobium ovatum]